ncbi:macrophage mannose receptor 1-like [Mytilus californianus]|uniref:macrophage mannose receptor 1-like n=1 Tax=Mytilus californianus TaxID=6549 RepID=UPI0022480A64|nr:macrophage mannose receptor 1-like [Mytilus californianus]
MNSITSVAVILVAVYGLCSCDQTNVGCDPGWYATDTQCYFVEQKKSVTRAQAATDCGNKQADLFKFQDPGELTFIQNTIKGFSGDGFWTDLSDLRFDGSLTGTGIWQWGQYFQVDNSTIPWEAYPTAETSESCGAMNVQGKFVNLGCSRRLGYICEIDNTANTGCPENWMLTDDNGCFFFSDTTNGTQLLSFADAQRACAAMPVPAGITTAAHLMTVDSPSDVTYLQGQIPYLAPTTVMYWTGLQRQGSSWGWANKDQFITQNVVWAVEPDHLAGNEHCGIIRTDGKFADTDCTKNYNYICVKGTTMVDPTYFFGCGGWNRAGHKCYIFYDSPKTTWSDARTRCQSIGSDLLKIESMDEKRWLEWEMSMTDTHPNLYWTGLNDQSQEGVYKWADSTTADSSLIRWNQEPNDWFGNEDCAALVGTGNYNDMDCTSQTGFICEYVNLFYNAGTSGPICPTGKGWINMPNTKECYYFSPQNQTLSWSEANDYCHKQKIVSTTIPTTLLAVNSAPERDFIVAQMAKMTNPPKGYWTSLNDMNQEGQWMFYDNFNNPPNTKVINWGGEPSDDGTKNQDCTFVLYGGRYFDVNCKAKFGFICQKYATGLAAVYGNGGSSGKTDVITMVTVLLVTLFVKRCF